MNVNITDNPTIFKRIFKKGFTFTNQKNIRNPHKDENCVNTISNDVTTLFEMGKRYSLKLYSGEKALVYMYISSDTNDIRVTYSVSSTTTLILHDTKIDKLSEDEKVLLREMSEIITGENRKTA